MQRGHRAPAGTQYDGCLTVSPARERLTASTHGEELSGSDLGSQPHALPTGEVSAAESGLIPSSHLKVYEQKTSLRLSTAAWPLASSLHTACRAHLGRWSHGPSPLEPVPETPDPAGQVPEDPGGPSPSHLPLKAEMLSEPRVGRCDLEEWLDLKTEEGTLSQGMQAPQGAGKGEKMDSPHTFQQEPALATP